MMKNRPRILTIATTFPQPADDRQPRFVLDLCKSVASDVQLRVIAPSAPTLKRQEAVEGVDVCRFRYFFKRMETLAYGSGIMANLRSRPLRWVLLPFFLSGMVLETVRQIRRFKPDVIHAHWWFPAGITAVLALKLMPARSALLVTCHGGDYYVIGRKFPRLMHWVLRHASAVGVVSNAMSDDARSEGVDAGKLFLMPMGVDLSGSFSGFERERHGVVYVGRLVEKKGVNVLVRAWASCPRSVRSIGLSIFGSGGQEDFLRSLVNELGVSDSIRFCGPIGHEVLPGTLRAARLLVFPSVVADDNDQEGLGLVTIEALGCGCPVLASDIPPLHDVIQSGVNGEFFEMGDERELAAGLTDLISDEARLQLYSENGRASVLDRYDWPRVGEVHVRLYHRLTSQVKAEADATG